MAESNTGTTQTSLWVPYHYLATITLVGTYTLMILGAYTSAIGAGLACPDWPTCYGTLIPFLNPSIIAEAPYSGAQIFAEWAHRTVAAIVGILIILTALMAWRYHRDHSLIVSSAIFAIVFLPIQVIVGGLTVTQSLEPFIVTSHLAIALIILISITTTTVAAWVQERSAS